MTFRRSDIVKLSGGDSQQAGHVVLNQRDGYVVVSWNDGRVDVLPIDQVELVERPADEWEARRHRFQT